MSTPIEPENPALEPELVDSSEEQLAQSEEGMTDALGKVQEDLNLLQDRYLRLGAEFENFKKRSERERQTSVRFATEGLVYELLPVLDHLEQASAAAEQAGKNGLASVGYDNIVTGVKMVLKQFQDVLGRFGIQGFSALGQPFDPAKHEAVSERETPDLPEGQVLEEFQKGYMLHERLVRPARVVVAKSPKAPE